MSNLIPLPELSAPVTNFRPRAKAVSAQELALALAEDQRVSSETVFSFGPAQANSSWRMIAYRAAIAITAAGVLALAAKNIPRWFDTATSFDTKSAVVALDATVTPSLQAPTASSSRSMKSDSHSLTAAAKAVQGTLGRTHVPLFDIGKMTVSDGYFAFLKESEGKRLTAYQDDGGTWTIGYGHTGKMPDGTPVGKGKKITDDEAVDLLRLDIAVHSQAVRDILGSTPVTQSQFEALVDFSFNKGPVNLEASTLMGQIKDSQYIEAADQFARWINVTKRDANGKPIIGPDGKKVTFTLPGLEIRAAANKEMMLSGISPKIQFHLEDAASQSQMEARKLRVSLSRIQGLKLVRDVNANLVAIEGSARSVEKYLELLESQVKRQAGLLAVLGAERDALAKQAGTHPAMRNPYVNQAQANQVMDLVGRIAVLDRIKERVFIDQERARDTIKEFGSLHAVLTDTAKSVRATKLASVSNDSSAIERMADELDLLKDRWISVGQDPLPGLAKPFVTARAVDTFTGQLEALRSQMIELTLRNQDVGNARVSQHTHGSTVQRTAMR